MLGGCALQGVALQDTTSTTSCGAGPHRGPRGRRPNAAPADRDVVAFGALPLPAFPRETRRGCGAGPHREDRGFTLVEVVIVIAIAALVFQLVVGNMGAMIPARAMDSVAGQLVAKMDWLRSEARLQGKTYKLELDLTGQRYRYAVPATDRLASVESVEETFGSTWFSLGEHVRLAGCAVSGGRRFTEGIFPVVFDEKGFTADQAIFLVHAEDQEMVWTIQIRGLTGQSETLRSFDGTYHTLERLEEGNF